MIEHREALLVSLGRHDFGGDAGADERVTQALLCRGVGQHTYLLARQSAKLARAISADEQARSVDESGDREVDVLAARQSGGSRLA
jgi:hypothetical protein